MLKTICHDKTFKPPPPESNGRPLVYTGNQTIRKQYDKKRVIFKYSTGNINRNPVCIGIANNRTLLPQ